MRRLIVYIRYKWQAERQRIFVSLALALLIWGLCLVIFGPVWRVRAQETNVWLSPHPTLGQREDLLAGQQLPETIASAGNIPCETTGFTVSPKTLLQPAVTETGCAVKTFYGQTASGGYTKMLGITARLYNDGGGPVTLYSVPNGKGAVVLEATSGGRRLHYYEHGAFASRRDFLVQTGEWKFYLHHVGSWTLKDRSGKILHVRPESIAFSSNGQWMVADSEHLATLLVNLKTGEITPFKTPYIYHIGLAVAPHMAVSDDGRTVVTTSNRGDFAVTDITSCGTVPDSIAKPVACDSAAHQMYLKSQIPGFHRAYQVRFLNDKLIRFYASYNTGPTTRALASFRLAPSGEALKSQDYMALGDSFASGEGVYDYFPETDTPENMCHLSRQSYPYLIGKQLQLNNYNSVACSGARVQDVTTYAQKQLIPNLNTMGNLLPGYKKQIQYLRDHNPKTVTIGIGGNDIGFGDIVKRCIGYGVWPGTCYQSYEDRLELTNQINRQFDQLVDAFSQIKLELGGNGRVYAIGYPRVTKENGNCPLNVRLDNRETIFANQVVDSLNGIIKLSAQRAGVRYVDVSSAFNGYRFCEIDGRQSAMNGVTLGDDTFGLLANESFHPNKRGHELYRQKIIEQTSSFLQAMPERDRSIQGPPQSFESDLLAGPKTGRPTRETTFEAALTEDIVFQNQAATIQVSADRHFLQPASELRVELHSDPLHLGTFTANAQGDVTETVTIPVVEPGFHTLHVFGQNIVGQPVDIYKSVYIASNRVDYDGDGIANITDAQPLVSNERKSPDLDINNKKLSQQSIAAAHHSKRFAKKVAMLPRRFHHYSIMSLFWVGIGLIMAGCTLYVILRVIEGG